jgi:hypothetical protein
MSRAVREKGEAILEQFATIWTVIEARQRFPVLLTVAGATDKDDTTAVARGLVTAAEEAGKRVRHLLLPSGGNSLTELDRSSSDGAPNVMVNATSAVDRRLDRERLASSLSDWQTRFDVIIAELPRTLTCRFGAYVMQTSDGAIVALNAGRLVSKTDRNLVALFAQLGTPVLGVVKTGVPTSAPEFAPSERQVPRSVFFPLRQR